MLHLFSSLWFDIDFEEILTSLTRFEPSTSMKIWILEGKKLLKLWGWNPCSRTHCVILEHYYSVDFPWWFHRNFFCLSIVKSNWKNSWNQSVKKVTQVIWQNCFAGALKNVSKTFTSIWRPNAWMDSLEKRILLYQFLLYLLQLKSFSRWMACFNSNVNDLNFLSKSSSKLV